MRFVIIKALDTSFGDDATSIGLKHVIIVTGWAYRKMKSKNDCRTRGTLERIYIRHVHVVHPNRGSRGQAHEQVNLGYLLP